MSKIFFKDFMFLFNARQGVDSIVTLQRAGLSDNAVQNVRREGAKEHSPYYPLRQRRLAVERQSDL